MTYLLSVPAVPFVPLFTFLVHLLGSHIVCSFVRDLSLSRPKAAPSSPPRAFYRSLDSLSLHPCSRERTDEPSFDRDERRVRGIGMLMRTLSASFSLRRASQESRAVQRRVEGVEERLEEPHEPYERGGERTDLDRCRRSSRLLFVPCPLLSLLLLIRSSRLASLVSLGSRSSIPRTFVSRSPRPASSHTRFHRSTMRSFTFVLAAALALAPAVTAAASESHAPCTKSKHVKVRDLRICRSPGADLISLSSAGLRSQQAAPHRRTPPPQTSEAHDDVPQARQDAHRALDDVQVEEQGVAQGHCHRCARQPAQRLAQEPRAVPLAHRDCGADDEPG